MSPFLQFVFIVIPCLLISPSSSQDPLLQAVQVGRIPVPLFGITALYDGLDSIYLIGGLNLGTVSDRIMRFNISSETLTARISVLPNDAYFGTAQFDKEGSIFYFGGEPIGNRVFKFDPKTNVSQEVAILPYSVKNAGSIKIDNIAYIFGGIGKGNGVIRFNMGNFEMSEMETLPKHFEFLNAVAINGSAYLFGQTIDSKESILRVELETGITQEGPQDFPDISGHSTGVSVNEKEIFLVGGYVSFPMGGNADGVIRFNAETFENSFFKVQDFFIDYLSAFFSAPAMVYVESLNRLYTIGGYSLSAPPVMGKWHDEIMYVDLAPLRKQ